MTINTARSTTWATRIRSPWPIWSSAWRVLPLIYLTMGNILFRRFLGFGDPTLFHQDFDVTKMRCHEWGIIGPRDIWRLIPFCMEIGSTTQESDWQEGHQKLCADASHRRCAEDQRGCFAGDLALSRFVYWAIACYSHFCFSWAWVRSYPTSRSWGWTGAGL